MEEAYLRRLIEQDRAHVWHPFTPMRQWREREPVMIEGADGDYLIDARGKRYLDGVSSLWCNVHGHRVVEIDEAIKAQLGRVGHTTMLGLCNVPATELAARLCELAPGRLNKVSYSDAGATAVEAGLKMAMGYWYHRGEKKRQVFVVLSGGYHGDTTGSMSVGYSETFHRPFGSMVFRTRKVGAPDTFHHAVYRADGGVARRWSLEDEGWCARVREEALGELGAALEEEGDCVAGIVVEPVVQGAAGMVMQPRGYMASVAELAKRYGVLLIADEVATGFGRTGKMFACEHEGVEPDVMCVGKGLTGGYLPMAATLCTDEIEEAFCGEVDEHKTLYHGHTYTGNPLAAAAACASLEIFVKRDVIAEVNRKADLMERELDVLRDGGRFGHVRDVRQRGLMIGIELGEEKGSGAVGFDPTQRMGQVVCGACREAGLMIRPLGNVVVLMPPLGMTDEHLVEMARILVREIERVGR